jgi:tripartite-type tricarboxylate transporter receptor subunit TctC
MTVIGAVNWIGLFAPAGTPRTIVEKLNAEVNRIIRLPEAQERFASDGRAFGNNTSEQFAAFIKTDIARWRTVIRTANVRPE